MAKTKKPKKQLSKTEVVEEYFSWINSWNYKELSASFEKHLAKHGYGIWHDDDLDGG